jgi:hypothetical protein
VTPGQGAEARIVAKIKPAHVVNLPRTSGPPPPTTGEDSDDFLHRVDSMNYLIDISQRRISFKN